MSNNHGTFSAALIQVEDIALDTKRFCFEGSEIPDFKAGQFFLLQVEEKVLRAYSIASAPHLLPRFELLIKRVPDGAATDKFLWKKSVGDTFHFKGPMGRFGLSTPEKKQIFIATGTGLAPMRSFWQDLLQKKNCPEIHLIFGVRNEDFLFCQEELENLAKKFSHFTLNICLSRPEKEGDFFTGRVTDFSKTLSSDQLQNAEISLCGGRPMIDEMKEILLKKGGDITALNIESW